MASWCNNVPTATYTHKDYPNVVIKPAEESGYLKWEAVKLLGDDSHGAGYRVMGRYRLALEAKEDVARSYSAWMR